MGIDLVDEGADPRQKEDLSEADPSDDGSVARVHGERCSDGIEEGGGGKSVAGLQVVAVVDVVDIGVVGAAEVGGGAGVVYRDIAPEVAKDEEVLNREREDQQREGHARNRRSLDVPGHHRQA